MEMQYRGSTIQPMVAPSHGTFDSSVIIRDPYGNQRSHGTLGRFASHNAATNFAVVWAIACLDGDAVPRAPFEVVGSYRDHRGLDEVRVAGSILRIRSQALSPVA
ncbi:hypothetical protein M0D69_11725 [Caballeronia sp. SEWSISQ10-4 2]|uniref:hypothetical protein n=1 Tax=Caballeronia sp. SEWSISQ10-4 2 TaxID=2937438 RepID=UPI00264F626E|nr:hypothetical protein [Caballeronia sp. SEWSISQ10-4 2]MDN7178677.1 hypothetical protein [Caballeronia sp. SEWSISQ10-4 2]